MIEVAEQRQGAVLVLKPNSALTADDAEVFGSRAREASSENLGRVVVDMTQVPFVDSRALEILQDLGQEMQQVGQSLRLSCSNRTIREVLDLTGLSGLFEQYEDTMTAIRSFL